ncbi:MAG TPA: ABC transporter ATP-binding protein [Thermoanaerobaculia bacterium]|nr:ABC transporter ATP-binding protein [Thermoanaerobaculia bacterium]HUM28964.1 ABC transporter ATP-binding protein [Thermoanaerobaculia bacterium]HXK67104.1 ABC transporter ATP-binding protein [Thermoanaerobaculia bacterium]
MFFDGIFKRKQNGNGSNGNLIEMKGIRKVYSMGGKVEVEALRGIDLSIKPNEFISVVGPSGSGKSTLMNILGFLDTPSEGSYRLKGDEVADFNVDRLADIRNRTIGFVFQNFNLLPHLTAYENIELPLLFKGLSSRKRKERVEELLEQVDLADRGTHKPTELSGGQMQRVAIARALACEPDIILADEPTGNLDSIAGKDVISIFEQLWTRGHTVVLITHDLSIARRTPRMIRIHDGKVVEDARTSSEAAS